MTGDGTDISRLLAGTAQGVQVGPAPVEAIVLGGRRRRSRRRAVGAVGVALAVVGAAGIAASSSLGGGSGAAPAASTVRSAPRPMTAVIASGRLDGTPWTVSVDVWKRAADTEEAERVYDAMAEAEYPDPLRAGGPGGPQLVDHGWYFANLKVGARRTSVYEGALTGEGGRKVETSWGTFTPAGTDWFVFGRTAPGVTAVTCTFDDGSQAEPQLRTVAGTDIRFFAINAPTPDSVNDIPRCTAAD